MTTVEAQWLTFSSMLFGVAFLVAFDLIMIRCFGSEASISHVVGMGFRHCPLLMLVAVFGIGVFIGHCWLPIIK